MSVLWTDAPKLFYIVLRDDSFDEGDFIMSGEAEAGLYPFDTSWPDTVRVVWFDTEYEQQQHPALLRRTKKTAIRVARHTIDGQSGLNITRNHAAKAQEAAAVKFDLITDTARLPFLAAEQAKRPHMSIFEIADEIWAQHVQDAVVEADRVDSKRQLESRRLRSSNIASRFPAA